MFFVAFVDNQSFFLPMLLADASAQSFDAMQLASWIAVLFFLVAGVNQVRKFFNSQKEYPLTPELRQEVIERFVSKEEFNEFKNAVHIDLRLMRHEMNNDARRLLDKLDEVKTDLNSAGERRIIALHDRLNEIQLVAVRAEDRTRKDHHP